MTNRLKGEVAFTAGGATWKLVYAIDALIALEDHFDKSVEEIGALITAGLGPRAMVPLFQAGLIEHHPEFADLASPELQARVKKLMAELGVGGSLQLIGRSFSMAFLVTPQEGAERKAGPRRAAAGTGSGS